MIRIDLMNSLTVKLILILFFIQLINTDTKAQPLAHNKTKFVGNVIRNGNSIRPNFDDYWNQVTAENAGKWGSAEPTQDNFNWTQLDNIYNYALNNNFPYRHHTLIWGNQEPGWISGLDSASQYEEVVEWIQAVGERYPETDFSDVVNEPLHDPPSYKNALGGDGETGWDWVIKAFELARQYLPNTELHLNEYSVINDNNANANFIEIINLLKDRGLIDGIGVQGHSFEVAGGASVTALVNNLSNLEATGLPVYITEFDINRADDNQQLQLYQQVFPAIYEHPAVVGMTLWGYIQYEIWQENAYLLDERLAERLAMVWLKAYLKAPFRPKLISPVGTTGEPRNPLLVWHASDSTDEYHVQVSPFSNFSSILIDEQTPDTSYQLTDTLNAFTNYYWRVSSVSNENGESPFSPAAVFTTGDQIVGVDDVKIILGEFALYQNYPNPFNPETSIKFSIPHSSLILLKVYNLLGEEIAILFDGYLSPGTYIEKFDGSGFSSGVYFYQLKTNDFVENKKLILMK